MSKDIPRGHEEERGESNCLPAPELKDTEWTASELSSLGTAAEVTHRPCPSPTVSTEDLGCQRGPARQLYLVSSSCPYFSRLQIESTVEQLPVDLPVFHLGPGGNWPSA